MRYLLLAPDPTFTGVCSGVEFENGVGVCESDFLAGWLCAKGFAIPPDSVQTDEPEELPPDIPDNLDALTMGELVSLAQTHGIPLAGVRMGDRAALIERIKGG
ncbi:MAG: hypothetical protein II086_10025 [Ruminococcus sp.]|nr:hypothetical protein [Ruminococcus sp.]